MVKYSMEIEVRYLTQKDLETLKEDIIEMWSKHQINGKKLISDNSIKESDLKKYFKKSIKGGKDFALIAMVDRQITGIVRIEEEKLEDYYNYKKAYKISDLVIKEDFRRKGVATALLSKVKEIAKEKGVGVLKARVYTFNEPAQQFFIEKDFNQLYGDYFSTLD